MTQTQTLDPEAIGARIDEASAAAGFATRADMFRATGLKSYNNLTRWARGERVPSIEGLVAIAAATGTRLDWLALGIGPQRRRGSK